MVVAVTTTVICSSKRNHSGICRYMHSNIGPCCTNVTMQYNSYRCRGWLIALAISINSFYSHDLYLANILCMELEKQNTFNYKYICDIVNCAYQYTFILKTIEPLHFGFPHQHFWYQRQGIVKVYRIMILIFNLFLIPNTKMNPTIWTPKTPVHMRC